MTKDCFIVWIAIVFCFCTNQALAAEKTIGVFVALADNASQGIVPVPAAIGNGDDPGRNLYWGTAEGLKGVLDKSTHWHLIDKDVAPQDDNILTERTYRHARTGTILKAMAYRGSAIKMCLQAFERSIQAGTFDLIVFIGHNGLMDFDMPLPKRPDDKERVPDCMVLCCRSEAYFKRRIAHLGGRPVLLTTQLMYPGAFIVHAATEAWLNGATLETIRKSAGEAYARNQKLSLKAGMGVFAKIKD